MSRTDRHHQSLPGWYYCAACDTKGKGALDDHWDEVHPHEVRPWSEDWVQEHPIDGPLGSSVTNVLRKIISGGQTGADQGGLLAGRVLGLETGGTAPPGFMTQDGPNPGLLRDCFGLSEGAPDPRAYPRRTKANILDADGTVVFGNLSSPGSSLTTNLTRHLGKPLLTNPNPAQLRSWIRDNNIQVLNVAGNRESRRPGIQGQVVDILVEAFSHG